jgi:hypothetical protein
MSDPFPRLRLLLYYLGVGINGSCNRGCDSSTRARKLNQCLFTHRTDGQSNPNTRKLSFPKSINCTPQSPLYYGHVNATMLELGIQKYLHPLSILLFPIKGDTMFFFSPMVHAYNIRIKSIS